MIQHSVFDKTDFWYVVGIGLGGIGFAGFGVWLNVLIVCVMVALFLCAIHAVKNVFHNRKVRSDTAKELVKKMVVDGKE